MTDQPDVISAFLRQHFAVFLAFAFREIGGDEPFQHNWHLDAIDYELGRIRCGENRRLIVTMPPRHLKSMTITTAWVAWMLGNNPALRFICVSYGYDLAEKLARDCLKLLNSHWFRKAFPHLRLTKHAILDLETSLGGGRFSTSVGGVVTGRGADIIIIDDPIKADDALSEPARKAARTFLFNTLMSRLNDPVTGSIILVMQRLHQADTAGDLLELGGWHGLRLPAIAEEDQRVQIGPDRWYQRRAGCALHGSRLPLPELENIRARDPWAFAGQYQQRPVPAQGNLVQPGWLQYYDEPPSTGLVTLSWDTASKTGVTNDYSVGIVARYYQKRYYVLDVFRGRLDFGALRAKNVELCRKHGVQRLLIEDAASGTQLFQMLIRDTPTGVPRPIPCTPDSDKLTRFAAQSSRIQAGELVLPRTAPWLADFVAEIVGFPNTRHDDQADALAQMFRNPPWDDYPMGICGPIVGLGPLADTYYSLV